MNIASKMGELFGIFFIIFFIISIEYLIIILVNRNIKNQSPNNKKYTFTSLFFSPVGKLSRLNYFLGCLGAIIFCASLFLLPSIINIIFGNLANVSSPSILRLLFLTFVFLLLLYSIICLTMKRLHDAGIKDWLAFIIVIPGLNVLALIVFIFLPQKKSKLPIKVGK